MIVHPTLDDDLRKDLADKDIRKDENLRGRFLPKMKEAYVATLSGHPDNVSDYKFFVDKVVGAIPELQHYDNPYVCDGVYRRRAGLLSQLKKKRGCTILVTF
jgi:hypothetical protein